ncbi:hypothetical protein DITRI_Ditri12bG0090800 [Diplodiscus trichospermus]
MALSISNHPYKIYVSTQPYNVYKDDQSLESPLITFKCNIKVSFVPDKTDKSIRSYINISDHDSWHEIQHHLSNNDQPTRDFISNMFSNAIVIPFSLGNLHWKKRVSDKESVPLMSTDDVVTSILDVCNGMVSDSGRKELFLLVFIKKEVIVPHHEYLAMLKAKQALETLEQVEDMVRLQAQGWNFQPSDLENMANDIRKAGLGNSITDALDIVREHATRESTEQAVKVRVVPAAETSIQALERVTGCNEGSKHSEEKCSVCMEEMLLGSQVITGMPCSHVFHGYCIVQWLKTSNMCPVCRFKLPTT